MDLVINLSKITKIKCIPRNICCPYISVKLGNKVFETEIINKTRSPRWKTNECRFFFTKQIKHQQLCLKLHNLESNSTSTCIAQGLLDFYEILPHELYDIKSYEELYKLRNTNVFYDDWVLLERNGLPIIYLHVTLTIEITKYEANSNSDSLYTFHYMSECNKIHEIPLCEMHEEDDDSQKWNFRNLNDCGIEASNIQKHRFSICSQTRTLPDISLSTQQKPFRIQPIATKNLPSHLKTKWEADNSEFSESPCHTNENIPYSLTSDSKTNRALNNILKKQILNTSSTIENSPKEVLTNIRQSESNIMIKDIPEYDNALKTPSLKAQRKNLDRVQKRNSRNKVILSNLNKFLNNGSHRTVSQGNKLVQPQIGTETRENQHIDKKVNLKVNPTVRRTYVADFIDNDTMEKNYSYSYLHALNNSGYPLNFSADIHDTIDRLMQIFPILSVEEASNVVQRHRLLQTSLSKQSFRTMTLQDELHSLLVYKLKLSLPVQEPLRTAMESNFYNFMQTNHTNFSLSKNSNAKALLIFCNYKHLKKAYHLNYDIKDCIFLALQFLEKTFNVQLTERNTMICNTSTQEESLSVTNESIFSAIYWLKGCGIHTKKLLLYYMGYSSLDSRDTETVMVTDEGHPIAFYQLKNIFNCDIPEASQLTCLFNYIISPLNSKIHQGSLKKLETIYKNEWNQHGWILTKNPKAFYTDQTNHIFITFDNVIPNIQENVPCYHLIASLTIWTQSSPYLSFFCSSFMKQIDQIYKIIGNSPMACSIRTNVLNNLKKKFPELSFDESKLQCQYPQNKSFDEPQQIASSSLQSYADHVKYDQSILPESINEVDQEYDMNFYRNSFTCKKNSLSNVIDHVFNKTHHHHVIVKSSINKNYLDHQLTRYSFSQSY